MRGVLGDVVRQMKPVRLVYDLDGSVWRVEDVSASPMPTVETTRVTSIQPVDRDFQHLVFEPADQVVMRWHEAEAVADEVSLGRKLRKKLHARVVVAGVAKDVLFGNRARGNVEQACVCRTHRVSVPVMAARVCNNTETLEPG